MVQALRAGDRAKLVEFSNATLGDMDDDNFLLRLILVMKQQFISAAKLTVTMSEWGLKNPQEILEHHRDSPKVNVFCTVSLRKVYGPFFFEENKISGKFILKC